MRRQLLISLALPLLLGTTAAFSPATPADERFVVEYYYKVRWGHQAEFIALFRKNHLPILEKEKAMGRILDISAVTPRYHGTEDGRWDYRVTLVYPSAAAAYAPGLTETELRQLYPDQAAFEREEQRRFELLEAHWDLPVAELPLRP